MINRILLGLCCMLLFACNPSRKIENSSTTSVTKSQVEIPYQLPYVINKPNQSFKLPKILEEISGLGYSESDQMLYAVQDENGFFFKIETETGELSGKRGQRKFYKDGDYEGIEVVGDKIYVVKSTGTIYELKDEGEEGVSVNKHKSFLNKAYNIEGLAFDSDGDYLILACKAEPVDTNSTNNARAFYKFDLKTNEMMQEPLFVLDRSQMIKFINTTVQKEKRSLFRKITSTEDEFKFGPSGIAIHPITKNVYIISSKGKVLIVCNQKGELVHFEKLDKKVHFQPEGIAFDPSGTLYISTEADKQEAAFVYKFKMNLKN